MKRLPLVLSVKCENWRMYDKASAEADAEFEMVKKRALERDNHSCRFCSFRATKWQEVHHANDDHADNRLDNLVTTCSFCHMCQHIGLAGQNKEAVLVWLPTISQADLHHLVRTSLVAQRCADVIKQDPRAKTDLIRSYRVAADLSKSVLASFRSGEAQAEKRIGTSCPREIANAMLMLPDDAYARRADTLSGIRLLPLGHRMKNGDNIMQKQIDTWIEAGGPYFNLKPNTWVGVLNSILG